MHINLGPDSTRPIFEVVMPAQAVEELYERPGFLETIEQGQEQRDLLLQPNEKNIEYTFLLRHLGRTPSAEHESRLRTLIKVLDWLSIADKGNTASIFDPTQVTLSLEAERSIGGQ